MSRLTMWVATALIGAAAAQGLYHQQECLAANAVDDTSLLQIHPHEASLLQVPQWMKNVSEYVMNCAEGFACGVIAGKAQAGADKKFGPAAGFVTVSGAQVSCDAVAKTANSLFWKSPTAQDNALQASKAGPCFRRKLKDLINGCAKGSVHKQLKTFKAAGVPTDDLNPPHMFAKALKKCQSAIQPKDQPNFTITSQLYKACGYPGLAERLANPPGKDHAGDALSFCQFIGLGLTFLRNVKKVEAQVEPEITKAEADAKAETKASEQQVTDEEEAIAKSTDEVVPKGSDQGGEGSDEVEDDLIDGLEDSAAEVI